VRSDAAALLLGATMPQLNLLAVNINYPSTFSALTASAILAHYKRPEVPIGILRPLTNITFLDTRRYELGEYASKVAYHWSGGSIPWGEAEKAWDPVELYRKTLAAAEDSSVTIVSIGFLDNVSPTRFPIVIQQYLTPRKLSGLLNSTADAYSDLNGRELIAKRVSELIVMGGGYPSGYSWNFRGSNPSHSAYVINTWEGRIIFSGDDVGKDVISGLRLMSEGPKTDPVRMAYIYYSYFTGRSSWDPLAVLYAADGLGGLFEYGNEYGYNHIQANGTNQWVWDESVRNQFFLRLRVNNQTAAAELDRLYLRGALSVAGKTEGDLESQQRLGHEEL